MINIENESSLHNTLKSYYTCMYNGETEVKADGHIYDIFCKDDLIIEIQTKNLSSLYKKLDDILNKNKRLILVHPVVITKKILLLSEEGEKISIRKSSSRGCIYDMFSELTKIYPLLLHKNFTLHILQINMIEERIRTKENVQSANKRRRFRRNWNKTNKRLEEILSTTIFNIKEDYLSLLPQGLPEEFSAKELKDKLKELSLPKKTVSNANLILWIFVRMNLIKQTCVKNRFRYYTIVK